MALAYPINIFRSLTTLKNPNQIKRKTKYWFNPADDKIKQKNHNVKELLERIKILERKSTDDSLMNPLSSIEDLTEKSPETKGMEQNAKDIIVKTEHDKNILDELIRKSNRSIMSLSSIFPWNFFPNTIDVEESRVTFIFRQLFSSQSHSVDIKDISNVFIESGFFFATLQIVSRTFNQNVIKIEYLNKKDAYKAKDIIEGLRTFVQNDINSSNYEIDDLVNKLKELNFPKTIN